MPKAGKPDHLRWHALVHRGLPDQYKRARVVHFIGDARQQQISDGVVTGAVGEIRVNRNRKLGRADSVEKTQCADRLLPLEARKFR